MPPASRKEEESGPPDEFSSEKGRRRKKEADFRFPFLRGLRPSKTYDSRKFYQETNYDAIPVLDDQCNVGIGNEVAVVGSSVLSRKKSLRFNVVDLRNVK